MSETLVSAVRTPIVAADLYAALRMALGPDYGRSSALVILAQSAFETGRWRSCWNWNLGNVKRWRGDGFDFYQIRCSEIVNGREVFYDPPDPTTSFRSFPSLAAGLGSYLGTLEHRFAPAWPAVRAGDAVAFSHALKLAGYYTADEAVYTRGLVALFSELDQELPAELSGALADGSPAVLLPDPLSPEVPPADS